MGLLFFNACESDSSEEVCVANDDDDLTYWVMDFYTNSWKKITTELRAENAHVKIYVDVNATSLTQGAIDTLASKFSSTIYPQVTTNFADPYDADGDGKTRIVITDIKDDYETTGSYTGGYFYSLDMFSQADVCANVPGEKSNEGDIIYIDCYPQDINADAPGTIAHEFQHMVNFSKNLTANRSALTDTWIDEGFAEAASHMCYGENTDRIDYFNDPGNSYIASGQSLFYWNDKNPARNLMNYSLSYLFFQYLRSQSAKKNAIFKAILDTTHTAINYQAIELAMAGDANLSSASWNLAGSRFNTLLLRWYATNTSEIGTSSLYSYDSEIATQPDLPLYSGTSITLGTGAGIVKLMNTTYIGSATDYIYLSVNATGTSEDFTAEPSYSNNGYFVAVYANYTTGTTTGTSSLPSGNILYSKSSAFEKTTKDKVPMMIDPVFSNKFPLLKK